MNKYVVKVRVRNADGTYANLSTPVDASSDSAAKQVIRTKLDREVEAGTLLSYGTITVRKI